MNKKMDEYYIAKITSRLLVVLAIVLSVLQTVKYFIQKNYTQGIVWIGIIIVVCLFGFILCSKNFHNDEEE